MPLWKNMKLIYAITLSMVLHFAILYIPFLQVLFSVEALNWTEWQAVILISLPVIFIDEGLKFVERMLYIKPATHVASRREVVAPAQANGKIKAH
jgi:Ca2+ transporting ATPase